ncbi:MAG: hypothetical protein ABWW70_07380 [Thermoproteota archaeon]
MARLGPLMLAAIMAVGLALIGVYAVKSSSYMDVSELLSKYSEVHQPVRVTVRGKLVEGPLLRMGENNKRVLVIVLEGERGDRIVALADAAAVERRYGPIQYLRWDPNNIVIEGVYHPDTRTIEVVSILQGCHSAYEQTPAKS